MNDCLVQVLTALAFAHFAREKVDIAVIEVNKFSTNHVGLLNCWKNCNAGYFPFVLLFVNRSLNDLDEWIRGGRWDWVVPEMQPMWFRPVV